MASPRTLLDASGRPFLCDRARRRIVCLIPSITETLFALGLGDAVVGVTKFCTHPPEGVARVPKVGGARDPDLERIRGLEPDLVVANIEENPKQHVEALREWGIPVYVTYPRSVAEGIAMVRDLGEVTGQVAEAVAMAAELEAVYRESLGMTSGRPARRVFYPIWREPYRSVNSDTFIHDCLAVSGGVNIFAHRPERYPQISLEEMASLAPEVILLPDEPYRFLPSHLSDFEPFRDIPAIRDRRVSFIDGKWAAWYGFRMAEGLRSLRELLV